MHEQGLGVRVQHNAPDHVAAGHMSYDGTLSSATLHPSHVFVCACVCVRVRACVCACVRACAFCQHVTCASAKWS